MADEKNLKVTPETKILIEKLSRKHGLNQKKIVGKMVDFFWLTGVDPNDHVMPSPAEELKKFRDTIIGFMRKQEADYIKPTFGKMNSMMEMMVRVLEEEKPKNELNVKAEAKKENALVTTKEAPQKTQKDNDEIRYLKNQLEIKKQELITMKEYFLEVCNSVEKKSTGMQKKNIVTLDEARFDDHFKWLRSLDID